MVDTYGGLDGDEAAVLARLQSVAALADDEPETDEEADAWVLFRLDGSRWTQVGDVHEKAADAEAQAVELRRPRSCMTHQPGRAGAPTTCFAPSSPPPRPGP